jgi:hypothetical protein
MKGSTTIVARIVLTPHNVKGDRQVFLGSVANLWAVGEGPPASLRRGLGNDALREAPARRSLLASSVPTQSSPRLANLVDRHSLHSLSVPSPLLPSTVAVCVNFMLRFIIPMMAQKRRWVEEGSMESAESTPSLSRQPRNTFENRDHVSNQAGQQNIYGDVIFRSV